MHVKGERPFGYGRRSGRGRATGAVWNVGLFPLTVCHPGAPLGPSPATPCSLPAPLEAWGRSRRPGRTVGGRGLHGPAPGSEPSRSRPGAAAPLLRPAARPWPQGPWSQGPRPRVDPSRARTRALGEPRRPRPPAPPRPPRTDRDANVTPAPRAPGSWRGGPASSTPRRPPVPVRLREPQAWPQRPASLRRSPARPAPAGPGLRPRGP